MGKKKEKIPTSVDFSIHLTESYRRWVHIFTQGCSDPTYEDGVNINLVRNHILYYKRMCEEVLKDNFIAYPDEYFYPTPENLPQDFMAVDRKAPILAGFKKTGSDIVPAKRYEFNSLSQVFLFDWKEVLCS